MNERKKANLHWKDLQFTILLRNSLFFFFFSLSRRDILYSAFHFSGLITILTMSTNKIPLNRRLMGASGKFFFAPFVKIHSAPRIYALLNSSLRNRVLWYRLWRKIATHSLRWAITDDVTPCPFFLPTPPPYKLFSQCVCNL